MGKIRRLLALFLAVVILFTGCGINPESVLEKLARQGQNVVHFDDMEYVRPSMTAVQTALEDLREAAQGEELEPILDRIYAFYDVYDDFYTNYALANIHYCMDMTDLYWSDENAYCLEHSAEVGAALEQVYYALAQSPCREELEGENYFGDGYFDSYADHQWDDAFTALLTRETQLQNQYYTLSKAALDYEYGSEEYYNICAEDMMDVLVELIRVRQEQAAWWGYSSYVEYASEVGYDRDYTTDQTTAYLQEIKTELVPLYRQLNETEDLQALLTRSTEQETFEFVRSAANNMGGTVEAAFGMLESAGLYDISYGENKYSSSFEVYLTGYWEPFVFIDPTMTNYDGLVFAHEFGHFCSDYASFGSYASTDVSEVFSQGMEYLSLCYGGDTQNLTRIKMADSLAVYVEEAALAEFEQAMYELTGTELTADNLRALYDRIIREYGLDGPGYDDREYATVNHYYTNPMYIISYVVSNDAAMQLYQMELQEPGTGLRIYEENLDTQEVYFLKFLEDAGLESPFAEGRIEQVRKTFEEVLK